MYIYAVTKVTRSRRSGDLYQPLSDRALSFSFTLLYKGGSGFLNSYIFSFLSYFVFKTMKTHQKKGRETSNMFPPSFFPIPLFIRGNIFLFSLARTRQSPKHTRKTIQTMSTCSWIPRFPRPPPLEQGPPG